MSKNHKLLSSLLAAVVCAPQLGRQLPDALLDPRLGEEGDVAHQEAAPIVVLAAAVEGGLQEAGGQVDL